MLLSRHQKAVFSLKLKNLIFYDRVSNLNKKN